MEYFYIVNVVNVVKYAVSGSILLDIYNEVMQRILGTIAQTVWQGGR